MSDIKLPEVWLRGPLENVPGLLQPAAHALLQANEEIEELLKDFDASLLWKRPAGLASVAFHLQHIAGVQDRLFTYAKSQMLTEQQLEYLENEGKENDVISLKYLLKNLDDQTQKSIEQLKQTDIHTLTEIRYVGRKKIPTTVMGLLFHSAEHTMRHTGQLLVTIKILTSPQPLSKGEGQEPH
ncbi:MAG: DinB family protein [Parafilimonas sp.]